MFHWMRQDEGRDGGVVDLDAVCESLIARRESAGVVGDVYFEYVRDLVHGLAEGPERRAAWVEELYEYALCAACLAGLDHAGGIDATGYVTDYLDRALYELSWRSYERCLAFPSEEDVEAACQLAGKGA